MSTRIRQKTSAQRSFISVAAQLKSVSPSKQLQQRKIDTEDSIPVVSQRNNKRNVVLKTTLNVDEQSKTGATLKPEKETSKDNVIVLVSDEDLSDEWEDEPKPDPLSSRGGKTPSQRVGDKIGRAGAKAKRRGAPSLTKTSVPKGKRKTRTKRASLAVDSTYLTSGSGRHIQQSLTDHFPVRRSTRKCKSMLECEKQEEMIHKLLSQDEEGLKVVDIEGKGRGVAPTRAFKRGELLCEYAGELLTEEEAKRVEEEYQKDPSIGCYMYYFTHQGKRYWNPALCSFCISRLLWRSHKYRMKKRKVEAMSVDPKVKETRLRLEKCWSKELNWDLLPLPLKQGCCQVGKALLIPPIAALGGLLILTSFMISPAIVKVSGTRWSERALIWLCINMPTGSTKSSLYQYLHDIVAEVRKRCGYTSHDPTWLLGDATCEKMGALMAANDCRLLGLYDEFPAFLTQLNLFRGKGLTVSHELTLFLQLYNGHSWTRTTVTGEANFSMETTNLTVGGFSQPAVARSLIDQAGSTEIGLAQRFLWIFPRPAYSRFSTLDESDEDFTDNFVDLLCRVWLPGKVTKPKPRVFIVSQTCDAFVAHFDKVQEQLEIIAAMDDLLTGMLSKSKGQILRVAAAFHVLFAIGTEEEIPKIISEEAIIAAIDFVGLCLQQTAFMDGHGEIAEDIQILESGISVETPDLVVESNSTEAHCLRLPGKRLDVSALLYAKKFRAHGYKKGAEAALQKLHEAGLGIFEPTKGKNVIFVKADIPEAPEEKAKFAKKLMVYHVSLLEYSNAMKQPEIQSPTAGKKRRCSHADDVAGPSTLSPVRRSPRKAPATPPLSPLRRSPRKSPQNVDATKENGRMGRLVNHSRKQANVVTKTVTLPDRPCLCLIAARDIQPGEELQYDYGDHSRAAEAAHPWLRS